MPQALSRLGRKLSISLISLIVVVGGLELVCRMAGYAPKDEFQWVSDPVFQAISMPDQDTWFGKVIPEKGVQLLPVRINHYSQRGPDYPLEKALDELRVIVLGDSLTFGQGVRDQETYPAWLGERHRQWRPLGPDDSAGARAPHVINAGVNGWTSWHYMRWAQTQLEKFRPDILVVGLFLGNDCEPVTANPMAVTVPFEGELRNSALYRFLVESYRKLLWRRVEAAKRKISIQELEAQLERYRGVRESELSLEEQQQRWEQHSLVYLEQLRDACRVHGVRVACLLIPSHAMVLAEGDPPIHAFVRARLAQLGIPTIECLEPLRQGSEVAWLDWDSGHMSSAGNRVLALALAEGLERLEFLPAPR